MEALHGYRTVRFARGHTSDQTEQVLVERPLQIVLNGTPFTVLMHTPGWERELVLGLLLNEGLIHANQIPYWTFHHCTQGPCGGHQGGNRGPQARGR